MDMAAMKGGCSAAVGKRILDIPIGQLLPDPNQPRENFSKRSLQELAESIKNQGLQQFPVVNFASHKKGKDYYHIKAGERRWRAHKLLGLKSITCVVEDVVYDGTRDVNRRLAQAAENSSREPHTHGEIIKLVEEVVQAVIGERDVVHGSVDIALGRVAAAFGKSRAWAVNYQTLVGLLPALRDMLDEDETGERLNFAVATALARAPADVQEQLLLEAKPIFDKKGHAAGYSYIVRKAREIRKDRGEKIRGRGSDDKARFIKMGTWLRRYAEHFCGERHSSEHRLYIEDMIGKMSVCDVDEMLNDVRFSLQVFKQLGDMLQTKRDENYKPFAVGSKKR